MEENLAVPSKISVLESCYNFHWYLEKKIRENNYIMVEIQEALRTDNRIIL